MSDTAVQPQPSLGETTDVKATDVDPEFYVVSLKKFLILFIATLGMYQIYWHYKHWQRYNRFRNQNVWPVARALFAIFFVRSLTDAVDWRLRREKTDYPWSPASLATGYVIVTIISNVAARTGGYLPTDMPVLRTLVILAQDAFIAATGTLLWRIQKAANVACGQPAGESNRHLTGANRLWIVVSVAIWLAFITVQILAG